MKILIIKSSALGDIIQAFPVLNYLRQKYPSAKIDWVVERSCAELVQAHPYVNTVLELDTKKWRKGWMNEWNRKEIFSFRRALREEQYDLVFDLQGNIKSGLILSQARARMKVGFGWKTVSEKPNLLFTHFRHDPSFDQNIRDDYLNLVKSYWNDQMAYQDRGVQLKISTEEKERIETMFRNFPSQKLKVMVCPGSAWKNKQMTPEALNEFLELLQNHYKASYLFVWGNPEELQLAQTLQSNLHGSFIAEKLSLPVLQNLMERMDLVIAMDSLPLHLAGTTSTSTFSVFGPSLSSKYKPQGEKHYAMQGSCPYGKTFPKRCPKLRTCPTGACIRGLTGRQVFDQFQQDVLNAEKLDGTTQR